MVAFQLKQVRNKGMSIFNRTFHPDEANQAFTTGRLLETGVYRYDPKDHHGPTLYYAAAAIQKASGNSTTATLDGTLLRCTPLLFGILTLLFLFLSLSKILKNVSKRRWIAAAFPILLASSPIFIFFATDFIQEMLLASFTSMMFWAATGYMVHDNGKSKIKPGTWALLGGISAGLAFATKETSLLTFGAMAIPVLAACLYCRKNDVPRNQAECNKMPSHLVLASAGFALTSILFYSSFASNWQGLYNAFIAAPMSYVHRAAGDAVSEGAAYHVHPWWQYLKWLFENTLLDAYVPAGILCGFSALLRRKKETIASGQPLATAFVATTCYSLILTVAYSSIPYKTPWCALQIHLPLLLSAFLGFAMWSSRKKTNLIAAVFFTMTLLCHNCALSAKMWIDPDSKEIPYNYASASPQVKDMAQLIESIASKEKNAGKCFIAVALPPEDTWPLPFYLRGLNANVGYWTQFEELELLAALNRKPDVVVVPAEQGHLVQPLFPHLKNTKRFEMRHRVRIRVFW